MSDDINYDIIEVCDDMPSYSNRVNNRIHMYIKKYIRSSIIYKVLIDANVYDKKFVYPIAYIASYGIQNNISAYLVAYEKITNNKININKAIESTEQAIFYAIEPYKSLVNKKLLDI